ncbi:hypothetical protein Q3G72_005971 [Acer saccharum]|nr:hypothetical protein Q3G72_005971 [Acer saccharum]
MADNIPENPAPTPTQIRNIPRGERMDPLFRKTLSATDITYVLGLVEDAWPILKDLSDGIKIGIKKPAGLPVLIHTPVDPVLEGTVKKYASNLSLLRRGWRQACEQNNFVEGEKIRCWILIKMKEVQLIWSGIRININ